MRLVHRHHTAESTKEFAECKKKPAVAVKDLTRPPAVAMRTHYRASRKEYNEAFGMSKSKTNRRTRGFCSPRPPGVMRLVHTHHTAECTKGFADSKKKPADAEWTLPAAGAVWQSRKNLACKV
jgi:hypothetical protein